jgi:hypothetical protein
VCDDEIADALDLEGGEPVVFVAQDRVDGPLRKVVEQFENPHDDQLNSG